MTALPLTPEADPIFETTFDQSTADTISQMVVRAISTVAEQPPTELAPIHETVDLEALEGFVDHAADSCQEPTITIGFSIDAWRVVVHGDGHIKVFDLPAEAAASDGATGSEWDTVESD